MGRILYPDMWAQNAYSIDYTLLYHKGYRGIIFDIDNTLVFPNAPSDVRSRDLVSTLQKMGFKTIILSNNTGKRATQFAKEVGADVVTGARKPLPGKYKKAMTLMGTNEDTTLCIGDQIFTDIWGANAAHICSILTDPLTKQEFFLIRIKRILEKPFRAKKKIPKAARIEDEVSNR